MIPLKVFFSVHLFRERRKATSPAQPPNLILPICGAARPSLGSQSSPKQSSRNVIPFIIGVPQIGKLWFGSCVGSLPSLPSVGGLNQIKWQAESYFNKTNKPKGWRAKILVMTQLTLNLRQSWFSGVVNAMAEGTLYRNSIYYMSPP